MQNFKSNLGFFILVTSTLAASMSSAIAEGVSNEFEATRVDAHAHSDRRRVLSAVRGVRIL